MTKNMEECALQIESPFQNDVRVILAGAGCGSLKLLSLGVLRALEDCQILIYDDLVDLDIVEVAVQAEKIYVGKRKGKHSWTQDKINELLLELAQKEQKILRLKGGDPFVFGRGMEEMMYLKEYGVSCIEMSGLPSFLEVPARFEIPLTHRGVADQFSVLTGTKATQERDEKEFEELATRPGTLAILMGYHCLDTLVENLLKMGKDPLTPTAVLSSPMISSSFGVRGFLKDIVKLAQLLP